MWSGHPGHPGQQNIVQVPRLEPKDLYDRRIRRDYARLRSYNTLLEQIYHRIYATSQLSGNTSSVLYSVPPFILGLPKLDMEDCVVYLVWQLRQAGFEVRFTWPNMLFISWKHTEGEYLASKNPIVQAMAPEPPPRPQAQGLQPKKKGQGPGPSKGPARSTVAFNEEIDLITRGPQVNSSSFGKTPLNPTPRRAADYEPPASFIQTLERPGPGRIGVSGTGQGKIQGNVLADLWS